MAKLTGLYAARPGHDHLKARSHEQQAAYFGEACAKDPEILAGKVGQKALKMECQSFIKSGAFEALKILLDKVAPILLQQETAPPRKFMFALGDFYLEAIRGQTAHLVRNLKYANSIRFGYSMRVPEPLTSAKVKLDAFIAAIGASPLSPQNNESANLLGFSTKNWGNIIHKLSATASTWDRKINCRQRKESRWAMPV